MHSATARGVTTRSISRKEFPLPWVYWLVIGTSFFISGLGLWVALTTNDEQENRGILLTCSMLFFAAGAAGALYPILRRHERQGVDLLWVRTAEVNCEALLFPCSNVIQSTIILGSLILAVGFTALLLIGVENFELAKALVATVAAWVVFVISLKSKIGGRLGILLTPQGFYWRGLFGPDCFVPWDAVGQSGIYLKPRRNDPNPLIDRALRSARNHNYVFGVDVKDLASVRFVSGRRSGLESSKIRNGRHLAFETEALAVPLPLLAGVVSYYHQHPEARAEIGTSAGLARVQEFEASLCPYGLGESPVK